MSSVCWTCASLAAVSFLLVLFTWSAARNFTLSQHTDNNNDHDHDDVIAMMMMIIITIMIVIIIIQ